MHDDSQPLPATARCSVGAAVAVWKTVDLCVKDLPLGTSRTGSMDGNATREGWFHVFAVSNLDVRICVCHLCARVCGCVRMCVVVCKFAIAFSSVLFCALCGTLVAPSLSGCLCILISFSLCCEPTCSHFTHTHVHRGHTHTWWHTNKHTTHSHTHTHTQVARLFRHLRSIHSTTTAAPSSSAPSL